MCNYNLKEELWSYLRMFTKSDHEAIYIQNRTLQYFYRNKIRYEGLLDLEVIDVDYFTKSGTFSAAITRPKQILMDAIDGLQTIKKDIIV